MKAVLKSSQPRPVIYMDESFIHHHYTRAKDSIYHPSDLPGAEPKAKHKGRRLWFIAGILSDGPGDSHVVALEIFQRGKSQPTDYQSMLDQVYLAKWFECLLSQIEALGKENAGTWTKAWLLEACDGYGIAASESEYKTEIWQKLKSYIKSKVMPVVVTMAAKRRHTVKNTPPYHSKLQPTELVWACAKWHVGRQHSVDTTFKDVRRRLDEAFICSRRISSISSLRTASPQ
ncbi:hypothetical protein ACHHYP_11438 [Achlya hypogyna]|uniref:Tc1-like transposase DDE domain-containing protein n=1 Tax=Achlya hypogyna TaxID=1202772 RepID=A0A1V9YJA0_ACHHY|nr:hypothetical protein ACHHYP_11438 [Achlya hypogyna]